MVNANRLKLEGQRFGRLTVIERAHEPKQTPRWRCVCDCGKEKIIIGSSLRNGSTTSCGCLQKERASESSKTHGHTVGRRASLAYESYRGMLKRCTDESNEAYENYGGLGITVCERWLESFENFLADMGEPPTNEHSIDRYPNNDGNYEPGNVRWATRREQMRNTRANRLLTIAGRTQCATDWAKEFHISIDTVYTRLRRGISLLEAITTPVKTRSKGPCNESNC